MTGHDFTDVFSCLVALAVSVHGLRLGLRILERFPGWVVMGTLAMLGWSVDSPTAIGRIAVDPFAAMPAMQGDGQASPVRDVLGAHVTDADMVSDYQQHRSRYQRDVLQAQAQIHRLVGG
ncbi:MAG: hypothetical protein VX000_02905 [Myxococcota bacterium]|nr:hypothetical protein [Myxococcota bacterium]